MGIEKSSIQIAAKWFEIDENVIRARTRTRFWLCIFALNNRTAVAKFPNKLTQIETQYVRSSSCLITIVVMTLYSTLVDVRCVSLYVSKLNCLSLSLSVSMSKAATTHEFSTPQVRAVHGIACITDEVVLSSSPEYLTVQPTHGASGRSVLVTLTQGGEVEVERIETCDEFIVG